MADTETQFSKQDQTKIYQLGRCMNSNDSYHDRIRAEGELVKFVRELATKIEGRALSGPPRDSVSRPNGDARASCVV